MVPQNNSEISRLFNSNGGSWVRGFGATPMYPDLVAKQFDKYGELGGRRLEVSATKQE